MREDKNVLSVASTSNECTFNIEVDQDTQN